MSGAIPAISLLCYLLATMLPDHPVDEPAGAASIFYAADPVAAAVRAQIAQGQLREAESTAAKLSDPSARDETSQVIRRIRREYSLTTDELINKLRSEIPDVSAEDVDRWIAAGDLQHRVLDGEMKIFRREPGHLLRFCKQAIDRRDRARASRPDATQPAPAWTLQDHLKQVIDAAARTDDPYVIPIKHRITYTLTVNANVDGARPGSLLSVWLPFPQNYGRQKNARLLSSDPPGALVAPAAIDGDPVTGAAQRTVYFEQKVADPSQPTKFQIEFEFLTSAYYPKLDETRATGARAGEIASKFSSYLAERPPHIVYTPALRAKVKEIVGDDVNPLSRARKIFYWIDENIRWTPEEEYCVIPNLSMHGFNRGKGDCGVAAMLFVTMSRIAGIPARWQSGWTTNPVGWNMHDWAEIYVEPWGWLPVDASYGRQKSDDPLVRDFYFGHADSYRLIVNLDYGRELVPPKKSFRSEPADFQRGEVELDGRNLYFDDWDYEIVFHRE